MPLYDFLAPAYDPVFESIYRPFRLRAFEKLPDLKGATVLDLACGTGQNFPFLAERIGSQGKIIGVDIATGMLRRARLRVNSRDWFNSALVQMDATKPDYASLPPIDFILCTYGFTAVRGWETAFQDSWALLKPGGGYMILDIDAERPTFHVWVVEMATRCRFSERVWRPLESACLDFRMDYLDPSAHLFGGRLFVAYGTKAAPTSLCLS